jgi:hypothetical protein
LLLFVFFFGVLCTEVVLALAKAVLDEADLTVLLAFGNVFLGLGRIVLIGAGAAVSFLLVGLAALDIAFVLGTASPGPSFSSLGIDCLEDLALTPA